MGYASDGPFASRPAYRWSCEVSFYIEVYIERGRRRAGGRGCSTRPCSIGRPAVAFALLWLA